MKDAKLFNANASQTRTPTIVLSIVAPKRRRAWWSRLCSIIARTLQSLATGHFLYLLGDLQKRPDWGCANGIQASLPGQLRQSTHKAPTSKLKRTCRSFGPINRLFKVAQYLLRSCSMCVKDTELFSTGKKLGPRARPQTGLDMQAAKITRSRSAEKRQANTSLI